MPTLSDMGSFINQVGVPVSMLVVIIYAIRVAFKWIATKFVEPALEAHKEFLKETVSCQKEIVKCQQEQTRIMTRLEMVTENDSKMLAEVHKIVTNGKNGGHS